MTAAVLVGVLFYHLISMDHHIQEFSVAKRNMYSKSETCLFIFLP